MKPELLVIPNSQTSTHSRSKTTRRSVLEQMLIELTAIASGHDVDSSLLNSNAFERWEGDETTYLEATIETDDLPEIDLSTREGKVLIRILWQSDDDDDSLTNGTGSDRGESGVYSAR
ncbi:hypothetical protein [Tautonia marina]|uniref:hypothetical protein n=1 Tax=Tautonia marina TaxID=2653855 RepID=UPI0012606EAF|nr:hypothetical protein [Tautonia marina]